MTVKLSATVAVVLGSLGVLASGLRVAGAAEEELAASFVGTHFAGPCDAQNNRLWLDNKHTYKTVIATLRWRAAGGKVLTEQFFPGPSSSLEIGCAAEAEVIEAKYAEF
jgi:hypothetical protein